MMSSERALKSGFPDVIATRPCAHMGPNGLQSNEFLRRRAARPPHPLVELGLDVADRARRERRSGLALDALAKQLLGGGDRHIGGQRPHLLQRLVLGLGDLLSRPAGCGRRRILRCGACASTASASASRLAWSMISSASTSASRALRWYSASSAWASSRSFAPGRARRGSRRRACRAPPSIARHLQVDDEPKKRIERDERPERCVEHRASLLRHRFGDGVVRPRRLPTSAPVSASTIASRGSAAMAPTSDKARDLISAMRASAAASLPVERGLDRAALGSGGLGLLRALSAMREGLGAGIGQRLLVGGLAASESGFSLLGGCRDRWRCGRARSSRMPPMRGTATLAITQ